MKFDLQSLRCTSAATEYSNAYLGKGLAEQQAALKREKVWPWIVGLCSIPYLPHAVHSHLVYWIVVAFFVAAGIVMSTINRYNQWILDRYRERTPSEQRIVDDTFRHACFAVYESMLEVVLVSNRKDEIISIDELAAHYAHMLEIDARVFAIYEQVRQARLERNADDIRRIEGELEPEIQKYLQVELVTIFAWCKRVQCEHTQRG